MAIKEIIAKKKYQVTVSYRDIQGTPRHKKQIVNGTEKDAVRVEAALSESLKNGFSVNMNFNELFDHYISNKNAKEETIRKEVEIKKRYLDSIGRRKPSELRPIDSLQLRNLIEKDTGSITQKNKALFLYKRVIKYGNLYFNFPNVIDNLEMFKPLVSEKFVYHTYTPEEFNYVLSFVTGANYKLLYETYYWCGLRRGEAIALSPSDLLETKEIRINKSISSYQVLGAPKNENSYRTVRVHDNLYYRLKDLSKHNLKSLFGGERYLPPSTVNGRFTRAILRANKQRKKDNLYELQNIRIHDLRHSHATFLASQGVPIAAVSARLGHSSITETMSTYTHLFKGDENRAVEAIDLYLNNRNDLGATKRATNHEG